MNLLNKILIYYKSAGLKKTLIYIVHTIINILLLNSYRKKKLTKEILSQKSIEEKFDKIYESNYWSDNQSRSGAGSSLKSTKNIRTHLPIIINKYNIKSIFDAPCGDLNWMSYILKELNIDYHGSDIVEKIIISNNEKFSNDKVTFSKKNIITDEFPNYDLMICRDLLFHFSYKNIFLFFNNFISSKIKYLLTTSNLNENKNFTNTDIVTGDYRLLDLFSEPFNFEKNYIYTFDDRNSLEVHSFKQMYLFSREKLIKDIKKINPRNFSSEGSNFV